MSSSVKIEARQTFGYTSYSFSVTNGGAVEFELSLLATGPSNPVRSAHGTIVVQTDAPVVMRWTNPSFFQMQTIKFSAEVFEPLGRDLFPSSERAVALVVADDALAVALCKKYGFVKAASNENRLSATQSGRRFIVFPSLEAAKGVVTRALPVTSEEDLTARFASLHPYIIANVKNEKPLDIVLGTMMMGVHEKLTKAPSKAQLEWFATISDEIDTARVYGVKNGDVETLLGSILPSGSRFRVASKANPVAPLSFFAPSIKAQFAATCKALKVNKLQIYYLHMPDLAAPILETLSALDEIHKAGGFIEFGLSNFPAWQVVDIFHECRNRGWVLPSVYQGMYNCITREVESELIPCLRQLKIRFYAYNPVAGGLLTDKAPTRPDAPPPPSGRFSKASPNGAQYRARYWNPLQIEAVGMIREACSACGITMQGAAHRWLAHHSMLRWSQNDAIIVGASTLDMLKENVADLREGGPLPVLVLVAMERAWNHCRTVCPTYYRVFAGKTHVKEVAATDRKLQ